MDFEDYEPIEIRETADLWGPFTFDLADSLPSGDAISSVTVAAYAGIYKPFQDIGDQTAITLIDTAYTPTHTATTVSIKLQYPGDTYKGKTTIVFNVTLASGAKYPFFFHGVRVK